MLGKESKITRTAAWACSWSLETEPQGEWGYRDIRSEWISAWGGRTFHGAAVQRRGAGMFIHGGEGQQALGKIIKTINSLQKVSVTGNAQWTEGWCGETQSYAHRCGAVDLLLLGLDVFPTSWCTWFWAERWGPASLFITHVQKSAAPQLSQEDTHQGDMRYKVPKPLGLWMHQRYPVCLRKAHTELFVWHPRKVVGTCWVSSVSGLLKVNRVKFSWEFNAFKFS